MAKTQQILIIVLVSFFIGCSEDIVPDNFQNDFTSVFEYTFTMDDAIGSGPYKIFKTQDSLFVFTDFLARKILKFNTNTKKLTPLGYWGKGPGEYSTPTNLQKLTDSTFAFTDIRSSIIKIFDLQGKELFKIPHEFGGGANFTINKNSVAVTGYGNYQLNVSTKNKNNFESFIPYEGNYKYACQNMIGGGLFFSDSLIYLMNSIQPQIYKFNKDKKTHQLMKLNALKKYRNNLDKSLIKKVNFKNAPKFSDKWTCLRLFKLVYKNEIHLLVQANKDKKYDTYLYNTNGKLIRYYENCDLILNTQHKSIFTAKRIDIDSGQNIQLNLFQFKN